MAQHSLKFVIVDYGMGNLRSVQKALETIGCSAAISNRPEDIEQAGTVILPGVGAFDAAIQTIRSLKLDGPIAGAISKGKPYLGICLGLQLLFESSEEGNQKGLGIVKGRVPKFKFGSPSPLKIPHMGWNTLTIQKPSPLFKGITADDRFYFVHSFYAAPADSTVVSATTDYGGSFTSSIWKDNVVATQFHPEKSGPVGLRMLKNFVEWASEPRR